MIRYQYLLMKNAEQDKDEFGIYYPDIMTFDINNFKFTQTPIPYYVTEQDIKRFWLLIYNVYGTSDYDDIVLWLNNIQFVHDLNPGDKILLPLKKDIDDFYIKNFV